MNAIRRLLLLLLFSALLLHPICADGPSKAAPTDPQSDELTEPEPKTPADSESKPDNRADPKPDEPEDSDNASDDQAESKPDEGEDEGEDKRRDNSEDNVEDDEGDTGVDNGKDEGEDNGEDKGEDNGVDEGEDNGEDKGEDNEVDKGEDKGEDNGEDDGEDDGEDEGEPDSDANSDDQMQSKPEEPEDQDTTEEKGASEEDATPDDGAGAQKSDDSSSPPDEQEEDYNDDSQAEEAPAVDELPGGVGDLDVGGPCEQDINTFCSTVKPGGSHLAECIQNQVLDEEQGATEFTAQVTELCKADLLEYKMKLSKNINMDKARRRACKDDVRKLCKEEVDATEPFPGKVIACLKKRKPSLSKKCAESVYQAQLDGAQDYRLDAVLYHKCKKDADRVCAHVEPGAGRVNACLREKRAEVTWECQETLFRTDAADADDLRLSVKLFRTCLADKRKFCPDVAPGAGRAKACLEEHRDDSGFGKDCKKLIEDMMEARAQDYRLDPALWKDCSAEIEGLCDFSAKSLTDVQSEEAYVVGCLQDFASSSDIKNPSCKAAVARTISRGSENIRFAVVMAKACKNDRDKFCKDIPPGDARVIRCLEENRQHLEDDCKDVTFYRMTRMSEDIDFNKPLKDACTFEIKENCGKVDPGQSRVVRCLQDGKRKSYSDKCKEELQRVEKNMGEDFRLNYRLEYECSNDAEALCGEDVCPRANSLDTCGGKVLRCLVEKKDEIKDENCKREVFYFIKMEVNNYGNDVMLAEQCRNDVESFCSTEEPGEGRVHACLRSHRDELSPGCAAEELKLEIEESSSFELKTNLKQACATEREVFCSDMPTGQARVFRCLVHNLGKADFGKACKEQIMKKLARRQQNWKLDVTLRKACKEDAANVCEDVDHDQDRAEITRCLMKNHDSISEPCRHEDHAPLSAMCDTDVKSCKSKKPLIANYPGKIMDCLTSKAGRGRNATDSNSKSNLSEDCNTILSIAKPPDVKKSFDSYFQQVAAMSTREKLAHVGAWDHPTGVTITGYTALACFSALCTTVVMTAMYAFKQWRGIKDPTSGYVQVVKQGDV